MGFSASTRARSALLLSLAAAPAESRPQHSGQSALEVLPPKMLELDSTQPIREVELHESCLETRGEEVTRHSERATFPGRGDKPAPPADRSPFGGEPDAVGGRPATLRQRSCG